MTVDQFSPDTCEFLHLLHKYEVQYVIIGGEAVIYYGNPRLTGDIDFYYSHTDRNAAAMYKALLDFWNQNIPGIQAVSDLKTPHSVIQFGAAPNRIDLLNDLEGLNFDDVWQDKKTETLDMNGQKIPIYYISLHHLIINKEKAGRNKDKEDLKYLRKIDG